MRVCERRASTRPLAASAPFSSKASPRRDEQEIVDQRIGRSGVEGDDLAVRAEIGDVADPAPVEDHQRALEAGGHRRVIDRRERRAFAARRDVGRTEVRDDVDPERGRRARAVAELARQAEARPMQDGLAVQADQRDALAGNRESLEKRLDRRDMGVGHVALEIGLRRSAASSGRRRPRADAAPRGSG